MDDTKVRSGSFVVLVVGIRPSLTKGYSRLVARRPQHQPAAAPLGDQESEMLAEAMAAFSTPSRLKLLFALIGVERTVEDLATATGLSPTVVSQQLRVLKLLRLATGRRDGRHIRYRLFDDHVPELLTAIRHHGEHAAEPRGEDRSSAAWRARGAIKVSKR